MWKVHIFQCFPQNAASAKIKKRDGHGKLKNHHGKDRENPVYVVWSLDLKMSYLEFEERSCLEFLQSMGTLI